MKSVAVCEVAVELAREPSRARDGSDQLGIGAFGSDQYRQQVDSQRETCGYRQRVGAQKNQESCRSLHGVLAIIRIAVPTRGDPGLWEAMRESSSRTGGQTKAGEYQLLAVATRYGRDRLRHECVVGSRRGVPDYRTYPERGA